MTVCFPASFDMTDFQVRELDVIPWTRSSGGPSPILLKVTGWPWISIVWRTVMLPIFPDQAESNG